MSWTNVFRVLKSLPEQIFCKCFLSSKNSQEPAWANCQHLFLLVENTSLRKKLQDGGVFWNSGVLNWRWSNWEKRKSQLLHNHHLDRAMTELNKEHQSLRCKGGCYQWQKIRKLRIRYSLGYLFNKYPKHLYFTNGSWHQWLSLTLGHWVPCTTDMELPLIGWVRGIKLGYSTCLPMLLGSSNKLHHSIPNKGTGS